MLEFTHLITGVEPATTLTLGYDQRVKSRLRVTLDDGRAAGLFLPRGAVLRSGDCIATQAGEVVEIRAAEEPVSTAVSDDPHLLARACYHLGNRHVALQIEPSFIRWQQDHVLDEMVTRLGLSVSNRVAPFEPEAGAYSGGHSHSHAPRGPVIDLPAPFAKAVQ